MTHEELVDMQDRIDAKSQVKFNRDTSQPLDDNYKIS